jgi:hypothetical protein
MFDQTVKFEDVDTDTLAMEHFEDLRQELGMSTVWSIYDGGCMSANDMLLKDRQYRIVYTFVRPDATVEEIDADIRDGGNRSDMQVSMFAISGSIKDLWRAADSCIRQSGTHHAYIEDFVVNNDGSVELVTGS